MGLVKDEGLKNNLIQLLKSSQAKYSLLFHGEVFSEIAENLPTDPEKVGLFFKENDIPVYTELHDHQEEVHFWLHEENEMAPSMISLITREKNRFSAAFSELYSSLTVNIDDEFLFSYLISAIIKIFSAEVGLLMIFYGGKSLDFSMGFGRQNFENLTYSGKSLFDYLLKHKEPLLIESSKEDKNFGSHEDFPGQISSAIFAPIFNKGQAVACLALVNKSFSSDHQSFSIDDVQLMTGISMQISSVITNAILYRRTTELKEFNEEILENIPSGIFTTTSEGDILFQNVYFRELLLKLEINAGDLIKRIEELHSGEFYNAQIDLERGEKRFYLTATRTFLQEGFKRRILLYTVEDITEKRELERQLRRSEQLAMTGEMLAGIAHEIKNPLTSIKGFADLLDKRMDDQEFLEKFSRVVGSEANRLNGLIEQFLSFARPKINEDDEFQIADVLKQALEITDFSIKQAGIEIHENIIDDASIRGSQESILQVFLNVIFNAIQSLKASDQEEKHLSISLEVFDSHAEIIVQDNGPGMSPAVLERAFHPFYTTKSKGTGLGLSISHRLITEHHGKIRLESTEGEFLRVRIHLPVKI